MQVTVHDSLAGIAARDWNRLCGDRYPFLRHEFLSLAEETGCVSEVSGWTPRHLTIGEPGALRAAMPLYEKSHSWGEFVFDWAWANAYNQAGLQYYPKLVSAIPFTPAPCRKMLLADVNDSEAANGLLHAAIKLAVDTDCSSFHMLFPAADEIPLLESAGLLVRKDCQFHWHNRGYATFDDFLATFTAAKRKKAKRDRRRVEEHGITFRRIRGGDMTEADWSIVYTLISRTFMQRGSLPYFNEAFFIALGAALPDNLLVILAEKDQQTVATAVFFESDEVLYGRYWGSGRSLRRIAFRNLLLPGHRLLHRHGKAGIRARHAGRAQDQSRLCP